MSNVLVTGGAGFIGSHVAGHLLRRGHAVTVLDDLSGGFLENVPERASFVRGSVTDHALVNALFAASRFEFVYHFAAYAAEGLSHFIKRYNYTNNLIGSVNLINASVNFGVRCFIFTSSIAVYGACPELPMTEASIAEPEDPYGIAKLAVEQELRVSKRLFDLNYVIFRPHNVYGEMQNIGDRYRNVVGIFMNQILQNRPMTVFGNGSQVRAFSYIDDVAPVIADAIDTPAALNQVFNIGADQPYAVSELARAVARAMRVEADIRHLPARNEVMQAFASHEKVRRFFGDRKLCSLDEGLSRMAAWVVKHGARTSGPFEHIEISNGLPPSWREQIAMTSAGR